MRGDGDWEWGAPASEPWGRKWVFQWPTLPTIDMMVKCPKCMSKGYYQLLINGTAKNVLCDLCLGTGVPPVPDSEVLSIECNKQ